MKLIVSLHNYNVLCKSDKHVCSTASPVYVPLLLCVKHVYELLLHILPVMANVSENGQRSDSIACVMV